MAKKFDWNDHLVTDLAQAPPGTTVGLLSLPSYGGMASMFWATVAKHTPSGRIVLDNGDQYDTTDRSGRGFVKRGERFGRGLIRRTPEVEGELAREEDRMSAGRAFRDIEDAAKNLHHLKLSAEHLPGALLALDVVRAAAAGLNPSIVEGVRKLLFPNGPPAAAKPRQVS